MTDFSMYSQILILIHALKDSAHVQREWTFSIYFTTTPNITFAWQISLPKISEFVLSCGFGIFLTHDIKGLKVSAARYTWANNLFEEYSKKSSTAPSSGKNLVASDLRCHASRQTLSTIFFFDRTGGEGAIESTKNLCIASPLLPSKYIKLYFEKGKRGCSDCSDCSWNQKSVSLTHSLSDKVTYWAVLDS